MTADGVAGCWTVVGVEDRRYSSCVESISIVMMLIFVVGLALILTVLWEAFETIVLPRSVRRRFRLTRLYYRSTWLPWSKIVRRLRGNRRQETLLAFFGPLSLLGLLGMWAGA